MGTLAMVPLEMFVATACSFFDHVNTFRLWPLIWFDFVFLPQATFQAAQFSSLRIGLFWASIDVSLAFFKFCSHTHSGPNHTEVISGGWATDALLNCESNQKVGQTTFLFLQFFQKICRLFAAIEKQWNKRNTSVLVVLSKEFHLLIPFWKQCFAPFHCCA